MPHMKKSLMLLALVAGCGGHDFSGTWTGGVERTAVGTGNKVSHDETWQIDQAAGTIERTRGTEHCTLALERDTCSRGCYDLVILAGQRCTLEGVSLVLLEGYMSSGAGRNADVTLSWAAAVGEPAEITETGTMVQQ
jgi:hypothetical protein